MKLFLVTVEAHHPAVTDFLIYKAYVIAPDQEEAEAKMWDLLESTSIMDPYDLGTWCDFDAQEVSDGIAYLGAEFVEVSK